MGFLDRFKPRQALSVHEAAFLVSGSINKAAAASVEDVTTSHKEASGEGLPIDNRTAWLLIAESLFAFYNTVDRIAFDILDKETRSEFMDSLAVAAVELFVRVSSSGAPEDEASAFKQDMLTDLYRANIEYGAYPVRRDNRTEETPTVFEKLAEACVTNLADCPNAQSLMGLFCVSAMGYYYRLRPEVEGILQSMR